MKISFFKSLWSVCCGTAVFRVLRDHSAGRTLWHLTLMSFLTALIIAFGVYGERDRKIAGVRRGFTDAFGSTLHFSEHGIIPEKRPQTPYFMPMPDDGGLLYIADGRNAEFPEGFLKKGKYFVLWSDRLLAIGTRSDTDNWQIQLVDPDLRTRIVGIAGDKAPAAIADELRRGSDKAVWNFPEAIFETDDLFRIAGRALTLFNFFFDFSGCLLLALLCTAGFTLLSRLTGAAAQRGLTAGAYWRVGVYAGFPGMLIGGLCVALQLPYVGSHYGIIYAVALVIYWLPASLACTGEGEPGSRHDA